MTKCAHCFRDVESLVSVQFFQDETNAMMEILGCEPCVMFQMSKVREKLGQFQKAREN